MAGQRRIHITIMSIYIFYWDILFVFILVQDQKLIAWHTKSKEEKPPRHFEL